MLFRSAPYIEARGTEGVTPQQAMMEALALIQELKKGDPGAVKTELKKLGIDLDKASGNNLQEETSKINALQERLDRLELEKEEQIKQNLVNSFSQAFSKLSSQKTRTGESVFPGLLDNSEAGIKFAEDLGSLTYNPLFQRGVFARFQIGRAHV